MQVMIVGGNQMKYMASRYYDYANKLGNGFIRNNHTVLRFFDRDSELVGTLYSWSLKNPHGGSILIRLMKP